tara:strand:- start:969 stop:1184 length:216 start_codon:yes stop_codon:yes gene_type:complete
LLLLLLSGCVAHHNPQPIDTKLDESKRDWAEVYRHEIKIAVENEDIDAYNFFFKEYMRDRIRRFKKDQKKP